MIKLITFHKLLRYWYFLICFGIFGCILMQVVLAQEAPPAEAPPPEAPPAEAPPPEPPPPAPTPTPVPPQVRVEFKMLEWQVVDGTDFDFAVQYTQPEGLGGILDSAGLNLPGTLESGASFLWAPSDYQVMIEAMETVGKVSVLNSSSLLMTSAQLDRAALPATPADFNPAYSTQALNQTQLPYLTDQYVGYQVQPVTNYRDVGIAVDVSILRVENEMVFMDVKATVNDPTQYININAGDKQAATRLVPVVNRRSITNRLIVPDRQVFICALMKTKMQRVQNEGVPWIGELPIISWFFSNYKSKNTTTELVVMVKPEILTPYRTISADSPQGTGL